MKRQTDAELFPFIGRNWSSQKSMIYARHGEGVNKSLHVKVRYDGFGNSVVRFVIQDYDKETEYEKFDAAVEAFNMIRPRNHQ